MSACGVLNLLKPTGMTAHDCVNAVRRIYGVRRVGHAGTLDPGACGVLPIMVGWATRLLPYLESTKSYRAELTLGIATDTQDAAGSTTQVDESVCVTPRQLADAMAAFLGHTLQVPPMVSAVRVGGRRLYELARSGQTVKRAPRPITIYELHVRKIWPDDAEVLRLGSRVLFDVTCSAGTYIRTLCADIGQRLGSCGHLSFLIRTAAAGFILEDAITFEELEEAGRQRRHSELLHSPATALRHLPELRLSAAQLQRLCQGQACRGAAAAPGTLARVHTPSGALAAVARAESDALWQPERVFLPTALNEDEL